MYDSLFLTNSEIPETQEKKGGETSEFLRVLPEFVDAEPPEISMTYCSAVLLIEERLSRCSCRGRDCVCCLVCVAGPVLQVPLGTRITRELARSGSKTHEVEAGIFCFFCAVPHAHRVWILVKGVNARIMLPA